MADDQKQVSCGNCRYWDRITDDNPGIFGTCKAPVPFWAKRRIAWQLPPSAGGRGGCETGGEDV